MKLHSDCTQVCRTALLLLQQYLVLTLCLFIEADCHWLQVKQGIIDSLR